MHYFQDDELDEEDKSLLADESSHIEDESLLSTSSHSTKAEIQAPEVAAASVPTEPEKKIVLKRTVPILPPTTTEPEPASTEEPSPKVAKVTVLTAAERLELRAKKFGAASATLPINTDLKKQARAERFGIKVDETTEKSTTTTAAATPTTVTNKPSSQKLDISSLETVSVEVLKKRAERFGTVSSKLVSVEKEEKLAKRQDRFGITAPSATAKTTPAANGSSTAATTTNDYAERAKSRLERFKQEVK